MKLHDSGVYLVNGVPQAEAPAGITAAEAKKPRAGRTALGRSPIPIFN